MCLCVRDLVDTVTILLLLLLRTDTTLWADQYMLYLPKQISQGVGHNELNTK